MPVLSSLGFAGWFAVLALVVTPSSQAPRPMSFSATLTSIKVSARPGQVVTRQFQLTLDPGQPRTHFKAKVEDWWRSQDGLQSHYARPRHASAFLRAVDVAESSRISRRARRHAQHSHHGECAARARARRLLVRADRRSGSRSAGRRRQASACTSSRRSRRASSSMSIRSNGKPLSWASGPTPTGPS